MRRLVKMILLIALVSPLAAQQMNSQGETGSPEGLSLSQEQIEAVSQIEKEFQERERQGVEKNRSFKKTAAARAEEREAKIQQILTPAQWQEYQKLSEAMREGEAQMKKRKKGKPIKGNQPIKID